MKTAIRIIAAVLAASLALVSCGKQEAIDNGSANPAGGARTIAVSFANNSTKSELYGLQPKFVAGDVIKVSNGTATEDCTVSIDGSGNASISTSLTGALTAVYPSTAAMMNGNAIEGVLVPTVQDGTFASANICKVTIAAGATSATFANQTAVFKVTPPSGVKQFTITSLKPVVDGVARTGTAVAINTEGADDAAKLVITIGGTSSELSTFFVSLVAGANLTDLSFEYKTDEVHGAMKGIPTKSIQAPDEEDATAPGTLYPIDSNNWHEYAILAGKKWATMNVGATTPEDYGEYFAWGETSGHKANSAKTGFEDSYSFNWVYTPYHIGSDRDTGWIKYIPTDKSSYWSGEGSPDNKTVLDLEDDAARANWGGSWCMPTKAEFDALKAITDKGWDDDKKGYIFGTSPVQVFLPAAGGGSDTSLYSACDIGRYWSSSLIPGNPVSASVLFFDLENSSIGNSNRYYGRSVRPVSD